MIKVLLVVAMLSVSFVLKAQDNVAYQDDAVRFTVVTDGVIRLEWQPEGKFTDLPSFVASERDYPAVDYKVRKTGKNVEITTSRMVLTYKKGTGKFTKDNLVIKSTDGFFTWKPGMKQKENLKGTFRTLDGLEGDLQTQGWVKDSPKGEHRPFEDGILAKDGWTLIDESENLLFDDSDWAWVTKRPEGECQDWYFMAYGHDYKAALKDFTVFAGKMPLPPRFTFGYWWSRYWAYSDKELRTLVDKMAAYDIPLDVLVVDMDWHYTDPGRGGWTGWTWNRSIFPDPQKFMSQMKDKGLKITINLHPAEGFDHWEECYPALAESLGKDPEGKERIEWINSDKKFMTNMFDKVMHPMQEEGVDFWWLDWQQHVYDTELPQLHNTWWINYCYFSDMERYGDKRPMLYHRWGGLGNHRYQIGFSGDATISWESLEFQPYFTATSSNVLYGYWSHDIGGHLGDSIDPEMYTRWLQYGGFSPVMRTHSSKSGGLNKEPWVFTEEYTNVIRQAVRQRYVMAPYIYAMARKGYDEGIALCRPMYYDYPECQEAYDFRSQYMFGDDMLIAPVTKPMVDGFAEVDVWLPEGEWFELHTGTLLNGGAVVKRHFALDECVFLKFGRVEGENVVLNARLILPRVAAEVCRKSALEFRGGVGIVCICLFALAEREGDRLFGRGEIVGAPFVAEKLVIRDFSGLERSLLLASDRVDPADIKIIQDVFARGSVIENYRLIALFVVAVIVGMDEQGAFRLRFGGDGVPHIKHTARVDVVKSRDDEDRNVRVRQRASRIASARAGVPEIIVSVGVEKNIVKARHTFAENGL